MSLSKQIKTAADTIDSLATTVESLTKELASSKGQVKKAQAALAVAERQTKTASAQSEEQKVALAQAAKKAAGALKTAGLLSSDQAVDVFASEVLDHAKCIQQLTKLAGITTTAKRTARVVVDNTATKTASADDVFEAGLRKYTR
jgi:predicted phage tail protein